MSDTRPFRWMVVCGLTLLVGCQSLVVRQSYVTPDSWLTEGQTAHRAYATDVALAPPLEAAWDYNAAAGFGPASPLVYGNAVLVSNRQGEVHGIDLATGRRIGIESFGDAVEGSPVVLGDMMYVPVAWGRRALIAYDLEKGSKRWDVRHAPIEAGLLQAGGFIIGVDVEGQVRAYDPSDGEVRWMQGPDRPVIVKSSPVLVQDDLVVVIDERGRATALSARAGAVRWQQSIGTPVYATAAAADGSLFIPTTRGRFVALDAQSGAERWRQVLPDTTVRFTTPAVEDGLVVFGGSDGMLRAHDSASGQERWVFDAQEAISAAPLLTPDVVYFGNMGRTLFALDRESGKLLWEEEVEGRIKSGLAAKDDHLIVLTEPRNVYAFTMRGASYAATP